MTSNEVEYKSYAIPFKLFFNDKVDPKKLVTLKMEDKDKNEYKISIVNCKTYDNSIECSGVFNYKAGIYKVIYMQYDKEIIKLSKNLDFIILKDIISIKSVYHYYSNVICAGELNPLCIYFDNYMECIYLSKIFLKNVKTNIIYEPRFASIYNPTNGASSLQFMLDFMEYLQENIMLILFINVEWQKQNIFLKLNIVNLLIIQKYMEIKTSINFIQFGF